MAWMKGFLAQKIINIRELNGQYCGPCHISLVATPFGTGSRNRTNNHEKQRECSMKKLGYTTVAALLLSSPPLLAMTDAEIEARFKQYEARINALESDLAKAKKSSPVYVEDLAKSVERVEKQLAEKEDSPLKINGFITAAATVAQEDLNAYGLDETVNTRGLSKMGVQLTYQLNDRADATIQLVARTDDTGDDVWDVDAEWAYLGYRLTDDLKVRAGRMRIPFYMYSESLDVGYSYPWVRPPLDVYRSPITAYDGVDLNYDFKLGGISNRLQFWTGSYDDTSGTDDLELKDSYGINMTSNMGDFTARAMFYTITIDGTTTQKVADLGAPVLPLPPGFTIPVYATFEAEDDLDYASIGFQWDNGEFFVITETTDLRSQDGLFFNDQKSGYISGGARIQDWTPYATYGWAYSYNEEDFASVGEPVCGGAPTTAQACSSSSKSVSFGLRKELGANLAAKFQMDHYYDFDDTNGYFGFNAAEGWDNADVYTISLDAVF